MTDSNYEKTLTAYKQNKLKKADVLFKKIKKENHQSLKLGLQLNHDLKKYPLAIECGRKLLTYEMQQKEKNEVSLFVAVCCNKLGDQAIAIEVLEDSMRRDSSVDNAAVIFNLYCSYYHADNIMAAEKLAPKLLSWEGYYVKTSHVLIQCAAKVDNKPLLIERLKSFNSHLIHGYYKHLDNDIFNELTLLLVACGLFDEAKNLITLYEKEKNIVASSIWAELYIQQGQHSELLTFIEQSCTNITPRILYLKAKAEDKLKSFDDAFNTLLKASQAQKKNLPKGQKIENIPQWNKCLDKELSIPLSDLEDDFSNLTFVFGFPRSGTTLLDNILDTQEKIVSLSEKGMMEKVIDGFKQLKIKYPTDTFKLSTEQVGYLRAIYFEAIRQLGYEFGGDTIVVDKGPHHTELLPLIDVLFPMSKKILTVRHPLDVCLSCFQTDFVLNWQNAKLITLPDIITRYKNVFSLVERYQHELDIDVYIVKYENLVNNFEYTMENLFEYIGIEHDESYKKFHRHAASKYVSSASRGQTDQALYKSSAYKWKNYQMHLTPYVESLQYFIEKYGYHSK